MKKYNPPYEPIRPKRNRSTFRQGLAAIGAIAIGLLVIASIASWLWKILS
jgi:hypothetical protein